MNQKLFFILLQPIEAMMASISEIIDHQCQSQKLFLADFIRKLMFAYLEQISSLRSLALELQINDKSRALGLLYTPFSTLKDGFSRFPSSAFKSLFESALASIEIKSVKGLDEIGLFRVIDGSLFPTLIQMRWSEYRKAKNAFKLHLSFELNRLIPTEFLIGSGKSSERTFLESVVQAGITYIADRGYAGFDLLAKLVQAAAYFIFRVKENVVSEVVTRLSVDQQALPPCFRQVTDEMIIFKGNKNRIQVRLIQFVVAGSKFRIVTNRLDLTLLKIII